MEVDEGATDYCEECNANVGLRRLDVVYYTENPDGGTDNHAYELELHDTLACEHGESPQEWDKNVKAILEKISSTF